MKEWIKLDTPYTQMTGETFLIKSNTIRNLGGIKKSRLTITNTLQGGAADQIASAQLLQSWEEGSIELLQIQLENTNGCWFNTILETQLPVEVKCKGVIMYNGYSITPEKTLDPGMYELWAQIKVKFHD